MLVDSVDAFTASALRLPASGVVLVAFDSFLTASLRSSSDQSTPNTFGASSRQSLYL